MVPAEWLEEADPEGVWPENVPAVELFAAMQTQWRCGPVGAIGLDYGVLDWTAERSGLPQVTREVFQDLQVMETEALVMWAEKRGRNE